MTKQRMDDPCPACDSARSSVVYKRWSPRRNCIERRRKCEDCGTRWTTDEKKSDISTGRASDSAEQSHA